MKLLIRYLGVLLFLVSCAHESKKSTEPIAEVISESESLMRSPASKKCNMQSFKDAQGCLEKIAKTTRYPMANRGYKEAKGDVLWVSDDKSKLHFLYDKILKESKFLPYIEKGDFVGAVLLKEDDPRIHYYVLNKGMNESFRLPEINLVDLQSILNEAHKNKVPLVAKDIETWLIGAKMSSSDKKYIYDTFFSLYLE